MRAHQKHPRRSALIGAGGAVIAVLLAACGGGSTDSEASASLVDVPPRSG